MWLETRRGTVMVVPRLELGRAKRESNPDRLLSFEDIGIADMRDRPSGGGPDAITRVMARVIQQLGIGRVRVPYDFPAYVSIGLSVLGIQVIADPTHFLALRRVKRYEEQVQIAQAQLAAQKATDRIALMLRDAAVEADGALSLGGLPLTCERLQRSTIDGLRAEGYDCLEVICSVGPQTAEPHTPGHGVIHEGELVQSDIFPYHAENRYHGDFARPMVRGRASDEVRALHAALADTQQRLIASLGSDVSVQTLVSWASDALSAQGYAPQFGNDWLHSLGHGVGLALHEAPSLVPHSRYQLETGNVFTIEPGLYFEGRHGMRIEDIVILTDAGTTCVGQWDWPLEIGAA